MTFKVLLEPPVDLQNFNHFIGPQACSFFRYWPRLLCAVTAELRSYDRNSVARKAYNIYSLPFTEKCVHLCSSSTSTI